MRVILKLTLLSLFQNLRIKQWKSTCGVRFVNSLLPEISQNTMRRLHAFLDFGHGMEEKVQLLPRVRPQLHVPSPAMAIYWELMIELIAGKMWHMWDWTMKLLFWKVHFKIWRNKRNCEILLAPMLFWAATFWGSQLTLPPAKLQKANRWWGWLKVHHDVGVVWCWKNLYDITYQYISIHIISFVPFQIHQNPVESH